MNPIEVNRTEVKMDDLPELPFEQILSHLSLKDRLTARAVSRSWYKRFDFKWKSLCCSQYPSDLIWGKSRWLSGAFARNFISSPRSDTFLKSFRKSILSNLRHLRLCDLANSRKIDLTAFAQALNSLDQLEELDMIRFDFSATYRVLELNLPTLQRIQLKKVKGVRKLTVDAPRLKKVIFLRDSSIRLKIAHGDSVERLITDCKPHNQAKKLKNLKFLYLEPSKKIDSTLLSSLELKEIHLNDRHSVPQFFKQKQQYGRRDLKIFYFGLLLNGPKDPAISRFIRFDENVFDYLAENASRLADEIPLCTSLPYAAIERVALGAQMNIVKRFSDLDQIQVDRPVQDVQRFLDLLKNLGNIVYLQFSGAQPQKMFDRLPEHSVVQQLTIQRAPSDLRFLVRLKHLMKLEISCSIDAESIRKVLEELQFLSSFSCEYNNKLVSIRINRLKRYDVWTHRAWRITADPNSAVEFIKQMG